MKTYFNLMKQPMHIIMPFLFSGILLVAQSDESGAPLGFVDKNGDGINDLFRDANGDGINDVTGQPYPHHFLYEDKNGDGRNDLWQDADGDGVNDLADAFKRLPWIDLDGDGLMDENAAFPGNRRTGKHVLDVNNDGVNDITGETIRDNESGGRKHGFINGETGRDLPQGMDADGEGMHNPFLNRQGLGPPHMDVFIDLDGDGISDHPGLGRVKSGGKGKKGD